MLSIQEKSFVVCDSLTRTESQGISLLKSLNSQRQLNILCDVVLVVQRQEFPAHKGILAANSNYFMAMFTTNMAEKEQARISLKEMAPSAVGAILDFIYTGHLKITQENVRDLLEASNFLLVSSIKEACCEFLEDILDVSNCLTIITIADEFYCEQLHLKATLFLYKEFVNVAKHEEFMKLDLEDVIELFSSDEIQIDDEYQIFQIITSWLQYDLPRRRKFLLQLMPLVRLHFVQPGLIEESLLYKNIAKELEKDDLSWASNISPECPRKWYSNVRVVVVAGGVNKHRILDTVLCYLPSANKWSPLANMNVPRWKLNVISDNTGVIATGGLQEVSTVQQELPYMEKYDIKKNQWEVFKTPRLPFPVDSSSYRALRFGNEILFVKDSIEDLGPSFVSLQEYRGERRWVSLAPLPVQRSGHCCVATEGHVFVIGGSSQSHYAPFGDITVQKYNRNKDAWTTEPQMTEPRCHASVAVLDDKIYVIGGCHGHRVLASAEVYDPKAKQWSTKASLKTARMNAGIAVHDGKVWVFGGVDGPRGAVLDTVECYNPKTGAWQNCAPMPEKRQDFTCCSTEIAFRTVASISEE